MISMCVMRTYILSRFRERCSTVSVRSRRPVACQPRHAMTCHDLPRLAPPSPCLHHRPCHESSRYHCREIGRQNLKNPRKPQIRVVRFTYPAPDYLPVSRLSILPTRISGIPVPHSPLISKKRLAKNFLYV